MLNFLFIIIRSLFFWDFDSMSLAFWLIECPEFQCRGWFSACTYIDYPSWL